MAGFSSAIGAKLGPAAQQRKRAFQKKWLSPQRTLSGDLLNLAVGLEFPQNHFHLGVGKNGRFADLQRAPVLLAQCFDFHSQRQPGGDDVAQLSRSADVVTRQLEVDPGELLPFRASFEHLAPAYLDWLHQREAQGWFWADGESDHRLAPPELHGLQLLGRLDRLDHGRDGEQQLIDYKTGNASELVKLVKQPLEDTQLAFYAALLGGGPSLRAAYLALDDKDAPKEIVHDGVHATAQTLLAALGEEWQRMQLGAPLPALGEGRICDSCEARGLCRRDQWVGDPLDDLSKP